MPGDVVCCIDVPEPAGDARVDEAHLLESARALSEAIVVDSMTASQLPQKPVVKPSKEEEGLHGGLQPFP